MERASPVKSYGYSTCPTAGPAAGKCWAMTLQKCNVWGYFPLGQPIDNRVSCALGYDIPSSQVDDMLPGWEGRRLAPCPLGPMTLTMRRATSPDRVFVQDCCMACSKGLDCNDIERTENMDVLRIYHVDDGP